jgi:hypothetical protein
MQDRGAIKARIIIHQSALSDFFDLVSVAG